MPDLVIDPRYLAPIATSCGVAVTITLWILNLRRKELTYEILSDTPLVSVREEVKDQVQIIFKGEAVHDVHLVQIRLTNSGNVPIRIADYEGRLSVKVPPPARILSAEVEDTHPAHLERRPDNGETSLIEEMTANNVALRPVLLNHKDWLTIKLLVTKPTDGIMISGHIEGIHEVKKAKDSTVMPFVMANIGTFIMVVSLFFLDPHSLARNAWMEYLPYLAFFLIGYIMLMCGIYFPRLPRRTA
jgi:hypothetical protein